VYREILGSLRPKKLAEDAKKMQHIVSRIWPIAAATATEERVRAVAREWCFLPATQGPYAWLEMRLEHA
jgi:hypothetical protein